MAENSYECLFLLNANSYARNPAAAAKAIDGLIGTIDGEILASRLWKEQKLAYPVKGHRKGVYWLAYFKAESTKLVKFNRACKLNDMVLRHLAIKIDPRLVDPLVAIAKGEVPTEPAEPAGDEPKTEEPATETNETTETATA